MTSVADQNIIMVVETDNPDSLTDDLIVMIQDWDGVTDAYVDEDTPSQLCVITPNDLPLAKKLSFELAKLFPGKAVKWGAVESKDK